MSADLSRRYRLGLTVGATPGAAMWESGTGIVYGRDVAEHDFRTALVRHGRRTEEPVLLAWSDDAPAGGPVAVPEWLGGPEAVAAAAVTTLSDIKARGPGGLDVGIWHDCDAHLADSLALRARFGRRLFPVTATLHVVSYAGFMERTLLPMMLQKARPCDALICTSSAMRHALIRQIERTQEVLADRWGAHADFPVRLPVIPLGVDALRFHPGAPEPAREALGLPPERRVVLWIGRLSSGDKADLATLFAAMRPVLADPARNDVDLVVAGRGKPAEEERLRRHARSLGIADRVKFLPLPPDRRCLAHRAATVFVSPVDCIQETYGLTPVEAMASGVPPVVADWNGYRDTVVDGETGFRVPTRTMDLGRAPDLRADLFDEVGLHDHRAWAQATAVDVQVLGERIARLLDDDALRLRMGASARRRVEGLYDWPRVIDAHEDLWAELAEAARALGPLVPVPEDDPAMVHGLRVFRGYPSGLLGDDDWLRPGPACLLPDDLLRRPAEALLEAMPAAGGRVADLTAAAGGGEERGAQARALLAWLLKQGALVHGR